MRHKRSGRFLKWRGSRHGNTSENTDAPTGRDTNTEAATDENSTVPRTTNRSTARGAFSSMWRSILSNSSRRTSNRESQSQGQSSAPPTDGATDTDITGKSTRRSRFTKSWWHKPSFMTRTERTKGDGTTKSGTHWWSRCTQSTAPNQSSRPSPEFKGKTKRSTGK
jgi:hypothetical protein